MKTSSRLNRLAFTAILFAAVQAQAYFDPHIGRWASRDPIGEHGGPNVYAFVGNDAVNYVDPVGLRKLTKDEGAKAIRDGLTMLNRACDTGCAKKACCAPAGCKKEAQTLVDLLVAAWNRNYGQGRGGSGSGDLVGGYFCWDWARIFDDAAKSRKFNCLSYELGMAVKTGAADSAGRVPVHYYLEIYACKKEEDAYRVSFDDGFFDGQNAAHEGRFPNPSTGYDDTNPPWPANPTQCEPFKPTPPPRPPKPPQPGR